MTLRPNDYDRNGDIIPDSVREDKGDLISREALKKAFEDLFYNDYDDQKRTEGLIDNAPTVETYTKDDMTREYLKGYNDCKDMNERPQGEWIADTSHCYDDDEDTFECSVCKEPFTLICGTPKDNLYNFCPNCGAKMDMRGDNK